MANTHVPGNGGQREGNISKSDQPYEEYYPKPKPMIEIGETHCGIMLLIHPDSRIWLSVWQYVLHHFSTPQM